MPDNIDRLILVLELRLRARRSVNVRLLKELADAIEAHRQIPESSRAEAA